MSYIFLKKYEGLDLLLYYRLNIICYSFQELGEEIEFGKSGKWVNSIQPKF